MEKRFSGRNPEYNSVYTFQIEIANSLHQIISRIEYHYLKNKEFIQIHALSALYVSSLAFFAWD